MITVTVNLDGLDGMANSIDAVVEAIQGAVRDGTLLAQAVWFEAVSGRLLPGMVKPVRDDEYGMSLADPESLLYPFNGDPFHGRVICTKPALARRYEDGYPGFDIKPGLLKGTSSKVGKHGQRYATVPFTHSSSGSTGQKGAPMPPEIYQLAQHLGFGQRLKLPAELQAYGRRSKIPVGVNLESRRRGKSGPMQNPYTWKSSPYQGIVKQGKPGHVTYRSFRRVSEKWIDTKGREHGSAPGAWIHPGQPPNPVLQAVANIIEPQVQQAIEQAIRAVLGG